MPNRLPYYIVDAFTNRPFAGNPAAVVPLDRWRSDAWLQAVAMEMNLSETAYLVPEERGTFHLRWFTPKAEVDLCGHATVASALVLAERGELPDGGSVRFSTRSGILTARLDAGRVVLDFPALAQAPCDPVPEGLAKVIGAAPLHVGRGEPDLLVELESAEILRGLAPDFRAMARLDCRGVLVTARSDDPAFDFLSRFFAPSVGIDEDPVTGAAHCLLAPYWGEKLGKRRMTGYQASPRGGIVHVELRGERVMLAGEGVIVASGELRMDEA